MAAVKYDLPLPVPGEREPVAEQAVQSQGQAHDIGGPTTAV